MYSYRNRDRLIDRIRLRRQELSPGVVGEDESHPAPTSEETDMAELKPKGKPRRSGVHFNEADRKILEDAIEAIPNPRDTRALTRLWAQLEVEVR